MTWKTRPRSEFGRLKAIRTGSGPTILLLHGVGLRAEAWNNQIATLEQEYEVIAPDMPGHGDSDPLPTLCTLADYTNRVAEALSGPVVVVGHSMGAMMALDLAIRWPDLVLGVAGLNAIYRRTSEAKQVVRSRADTLMSGNVPDPLIPIGRWFGATASPEADACHHWLTSVNPEGYKSAYSIFAAEDGQADHDLASLPCPALFMTGSEEPNSTPQMSHAMAALAPNGRAITIEGAAHMMPMTHSASVNEALIGFIQECTE